MVLSHRDKSAAYRNATSKTSHSLWGNILAAFNPICMSPFRITTFEEYQLACRIAETNPDAFWRGMADACLWQAPFNAVQTGTMATGDVQWFEGGCLNLSENCIDRHIAAGLGEKTAIIWEGNDPQTPARTNNYNELLLEVERLCWVLYGLGVRPADRVVIYMPVVPEAAFAMLACARMGAVHSVVFAGFSAESLAGRINDCGAKIVLTADSFFRGEKDVKLKFIVDEALQHCPGVEHVVVHKASGHEVPWNPERDHWWHQLRRHHAHEPYPAFQAPSDHPLFILYTSGSTGKPKGLLHTTAGYTVWANYTFQNVFQWQAADLFFCTADIGWITGHTYALYGPLLAGGTTLLFEGVPTYPTPARFWSIIEKYNVTHFYTAPTAIRSLMAAGNTWLEGKPMASLRVIGSVGEPINEEAWHWYDAHVGHHRCPIVDTWWQTETGGIMISPLAGITPTRPGYATLPLPGIFLAIINADGLEDMNEDAEGRLCVSRPWPGMARTIYGDHQRYLDTYFAASPGYYTTGDGARRETDGYYRITGRVDDVIIVSGHNLSTAEIESAINQHPAVVESAVVAFPHPIKGNGIFAYVVLHPDATATPLPQLRTEIEAEVVKQIGALARPDRLLVVPGLPKTRSGKIMRRILRKISEGDTQNFGDISTLLDGTIVDAIAQAYAAAQPV